MMICTCGWTTWPSRGFGCHLQRLNLYNAEDDALTLGRLTHCRLPLLGGGRGDGRSGHSVLVDCLQCEQQASEPFLQSCDVQAWSIDIHHSGGPWISFKMGLEKSLFGHNQQW
jgi:hypothetical protein